MRKTSAFLAIITFALCFFFLSNPVLAQELEVEYPEVGEITRESIEKEGLPGYIIYAVQFLVVFAIIVTIFSLVRGGLFWMVSEGDPVKIKDAKEQFSSAIMGFLIVLSSFLFLSAINPVLIQMEKFEIKETEREFPPGIHFSFREEFSKEEAYRITSSVSNFEELRGQFKSIRIANQVKQDGELPGYYYAVVLHELPAFRGRCEVFKNKETEPADFKVSGSFTSATVIRIKDDPSIPEDDYVKVYEHPDFRDDHPFENFRSEYLDIKAGGFTSLSVSEVWSIDINGKYGVILASGDSWENTGDGCGVFLDFKPIPDLKGHHMNKCNSFMEAPLFSSYNSCATHYAVFPLFR